MFLWVICCCLFLNTGTQKSIPMSTKGNQYVAPLGTFSSTGTMYDLGDIHVEEPEETTSDQGSDSDTAETESSTRRKRAESPEYVPQGSESSSGDESTPQKPKKKICKRLVMELK